MIPTKNELPTPGAVGLSQLVLSLKIMWIRFRLCMPEEAIEIELMPDGPEREKRKARYDLAFRNHCRCECPSDEVMTHDGLHCWDCEKPIEENAGLSGGGYDDANSQS